MPRQRRAGRPIAAGVLIWLMLLQAGCGGSSTGGAPPVAPSPAPLAGGSPVASPIPMATAAATPTPGAPSVPTATPAGTPSASRLPLPPHGLTAADVPQIVASVNGRPVPTWLFLSRVNFHLAVRENALVAGQPVTPIPQSQVPGIEQQALQEVIVNALQVAHGEAQGLAPSAKEAAAEYKRVIQRRGGPAASQQQVAQEFLTAAQDRIFARDALVTQRVLDRFIGGLHQPVENISLRMIVVPTKTEAQRVRGLLASTYDWTDLAARYSTDTVGRAAGGEQPLLVRGHADVALWRAADALPERRLSAPLHLATGWAIIEVVRKLPALETYTADLARYHSWVQGLRRQARITSYIPLRWGS